MVQGFPVLQRVHEGLAVPVILVVLVEIGAGEHERGCLAAVRFEADMVKVAAHAQEKCPPEDIGRFQGAGVQ